MNKEMLKKIKLGIISLSVIGVLGACADTTEEPIEDPGVEEPGAPEGEPAEDPQVDPEDDDGADDTDNGADE